MFENEEKGVLTDKSRYFRVYTPSFGSEVDIITTKEGKVIDDTARGYNFYKKHIMVVHQDRTYSLFDKNGEPLQGAYRQPILYVKEGFLGNIYYGTTLQKVMKRFKKRNMSDYLLPLMPLLCLAAVFPSTYAHIKNSIDSYNQQKAQAKKEREEALAVENRQQATLIKINGDIALFDLDGDQKTDYTAHRLKVPDKVFLNENEGQTKTIGAWKANLSPRAVFTKYNRPQNEKQ